MSHPLFPLLPHPLAKWEPLFPLLPYPLDPRLASHSVPPLANHTIRHTFFLARLSGASLSMGHPKPIYSQTSSPRHHPTTKPFHTCPGQKVRCHPPTWSGCLERFVCFMGVYGSVFWCVHKSCDKHENRGINGSGSDECMNDGGYSMFCF